MTGVGDLDYSPGKGESDSNVSGIIGHTTYAILAAKAAAGRRLPVAPLIHRHFSSYLAGAYLGCDIQTMPAAICVDTGKGVGHGPGRLDRSPITGGNVEPWQFVFEGERFTPRKIHDTFYGRSHLILGWSPGEAGLKVSLATLSDYLADVTGDAVELFGPGERPLAYALGWMTHVTGDGLIKAVLDGINLHLLDGQYTARNRPVQDLFSYHEIGIRELGLNWPALLDDLAGTPVEGIQAHYMRCATRQGRLGSHFSEGWLPDREPLLRAVMMENRRYQGERNVRLVDQLALAKGECDPELSKLAGGLRYVEMKEAAEQADFRQALWQMGEIIADLFERLVETQERLQELPTSDGPDWETLTRRWRA